CVQGTHWPFSF
nr:immunoglobulin light chain junction region [Macaca mulatta]